MITNEEQSNLFLEQYRLGELRNHEGRDRVETLGDLPSRLAALDASDEAILARYPAGWFADRVAERIATERPARNRRSARGYRAVPAIAAFALAAALVPFAMIAVRDVDDAATTAGLVSGERIKGLEPALSIYREDPVGGEIEELQPRASVGSGTHVQLAYRAAGAVSGVILSIDGNGIVTLHYPAMESMPATLEGGGETLLPFSYVLDDAPRYERFYFLACTEPISVRSVLDATETAIDRGERVDDALASYASSLSGTSWIQRFELLKTGD